MLLQEKKSNTKTTSNFFVEPYRVEVKKLNSAIALVASIYSKKIMHR